MSAPELSILRLCDEIAAAIEACGRATHALHSPPLSALAQAPPLLQDVLPSTAVAGVRERLLRVQRHLLRMLIREDALDVERACRVLQHLYADSAIEWAPRVHQLAAALNFELHRSPREVSCGRMLEDVVDAD